MERNGVKTRRNLALWIILLFFLVWVFLTHTHVGSFNDRSRMAAIESLVHRDTWIIDDSPFSRTVDRILVKDHFYSDKPPVLTFIASGVYTILHRGFQLTLDASWRDLDRAPCHCRAFCDDDPDRAYYWLTLALVGLPSALMLGLFYHLTGRFGINNPSALLLTVSLGLATQVLPYSTVFNSHVPAAACLFAGFYALLKAGDARDAARRWLFVAGLLVALAATFDLGVGLFLVACFGYAVWIHRRRAWPYILGAMLPLLLMAVLDYQIVGNLLPPYMYTQGYDYPGSRFPQTVAGNRSPDNVLLYGLRLLSGDHGLFAFSPVLLWAVVALVRTWRRRADPLRGIAALVGLTSGAFALYFILFTDNFGGDAYGPRWYTVFIPLLFIFVAATWDRLRARVSWFLFLALTVLSFINSFQGALNPWRKSAPLLWLEYARPGQREPVNVALSGIAFEELEPHFLDTFATRRVDKRWFDARSCLVIPPGSTWLFVGPDTPLDPALAERSGLASGGSLAGHFDLRPAWDAYAYGERLETLAWISPALVSSNSDPLEPVALPASFGDQLAFVGYELLSDEASAGAEIALITAWQVERKPEPPLALFVHLLNSQGHIAGQYDGLGANPDGLYQGDVLLHVHRFKVIPNATPGAYWLQVGLYDPETRTRLLLTDQDGDRLLLTTVEVTGQ
jgi:MFS family permease